MKLVNPKFSNRMILFIEHSIKNAPFWDVCCDHGYVGIKALESAQFPHVHFVDQVPHIMQRLNQLITQLFSNKYTHFTLHIKSGEDIDMDVTGTLLIAGVGGLTIVNIVTKLRLENRLKAKRLLLSPHTDEKVLINFLKSESFLQDYQVTSRIEIPEGKRMRPLYIIDLNLM